LVQAGHLIFFTASHKGKSAKSTQSACKIISSGLIHAFWAGLSLNTCSIRIHSGTFVTMAQIHSKSEDHFKALCKLSLSFAVKYTVKGSHNAETYACNAASHILFHEITLGSKYFVSKIFFILLNFSNLSIFSKFSIAGLEMFFIACLSFSILLIIWF